MTVSKKNMIILVIRTGLSCELKTRDIQNYPARDKMFSPKEVESMITFPNLVKVILVECIKSIVSHDNVHNMKT